VTVRRVAVAAKVMPEEAAVLDSMAGSNGITRSKALAALVSDALQDARVAGLPAPRARRRYEGRAEPRPALLSPGSPGVVPAGEGHPVVTDVLRSHRAAEQRIRAAMLDVFSTSTTPANDAVRLLLLVAGPADAIVGKVQSAARTMREANVEGEP
jgi:hypothetical protein